MFFLYRLLVQLFAVVAIVLRRFLRLGHFVAAELLGSLVVARIYTEASPPKSLIQGYWILIGSGVVVAMLSAIVELHKTAHQFDAGYMPRMYPPLVRIRQMLSLVLLPLLVVLAITSIPNVVAQCYAMVLSSLYLATSVETKPPDWVGRLDRKALEAFRRITRPRHRPFTV